MVIRQSEILGDIYRVLNPAEWSKSKAIDL